MRRMYGYYYANMQEEYYEAPQKQKETAREKEQEQKAGKQCAEQVPAKETEPLPQEQTEEMPREEPGQPAEEQPPEEKPVPQTAATNRLQEEAEANREQVRSCLQQVREEFSGLQGTMREMFRQMQGLLLLPSLEKLARVQQQMSLAGAEETRVYALELAEVLCGFGAKQIWPEPGAAFEPVRHERRSLQQHGEVVQSCYAGGWELEDTVFVKAIVDIA